MLTRISHRSKILCNAYSTVSRPLDPWNSLISSDTRINQYGDRILSGTTYIAKDNIVTKDGVTTSASHMLSNYHSPFNATVIELLADNGSSLIGKSNLDEFGMGSSTTNTYYGPTINPQDNDEKRISGGSSGGSAAAVAAGLATFSLGTDTGGSIRLPASYCGVIGLKPTYGRISRWGVVPYAQTLDTVGIIGKDVDVIEKVYETLNKYDKKDPTSMTTKVRSLVRNTFDEKLIIGIPEEFIIEELDESTKEQWLHYINGLKSLGHDFKVVSIPSIKKSLSTYYTLATAEAASNLSRYDGVRYGFTEDEIQPSASDLITSNRSDSLGLEVQRRIILGNYTLSSVSGDHYLRATKVRQELVNEFNDVFKLPHVLLEDIEKVKSNKCDLLISPTSMGKPPTIKEYTENNDKNFLNSYLNDILTVPSSLAGLPSISVPMKDGSGLQLMSQYGDDELLFRITRQLLTL
ncbi:amidase signature domain-containing protein [Scheffersomyces coipomensis]|uniref:amidase signature domain-containing protein n=1 Tax=Scheffersomyces coipomensis TaxID=1788519 RepID=UPI00315C5A8B